MVRVTIRATFVIIKFAGLIISKTVGNLIGPALQIYETVETIKEILATPPIQQTC